MTLDEAIRHCEEKANENKAEATKIAREKRPFLEYARCKQCANDYEQLASWLKELKAYKERPQGDLISREALKKMVYAEFGNSNLTDAFNNIIDNAPTITPQALLNGIVEIIDKSGITTVDELLELLKAVRNDI